MPSYKLHYFNLRARGELPRLLFAAAGVEYEDVRFTFEEWPAKKQNFIFRQTPVLEVDGKQLAQGYAIARYLANEYGFAGKTKWEAAEADMYTCAVEDLFILARDYFVLKDEARKAEILKAIQTQRGPSILGGFEAALEKSTSGYLVGDGLTYADLALIYLLDFMDVMIGPPSKQIVAGFPNLQKHRQKIESLPKIATWIKNRPKTDRFAGKTKWEAAEADMYTCAVEDLFILARDYFVLKDEARKAEILKAIQTQRGPSILGGFEAALEKSTSGYLVGDGLTYADLALIYLLDFMDVMIGPPSKQIVAGFPNLQKHRQKIESLPKIAAWIKNRPKTDR